MAKDYSVFDVVGPNMIGPSSSHTAWAARLGKTASKIAGKPVKEVKFYLHGSFAETYKGHGTDKALVGGILGFDPEDARIRDSFDIANQNNVKFEFIKTNLGENEHPNSVRMEMILEDGSECVVKGASMTVGYQNNLIDIGKKIKDSCVKLYLNPEKCSYKSLGYIDDITALKTSSNYYQFLLAIKSTGNKYSYNMKLDVNEDNFNLYRDVFKQYGLGNTTGIDLPNEPTGLRGGKIAGDLLLNLAIGQYDTYTILSLGQYMNTIANNGIRYKLNLVDYVTNEKSEVIYSYKPVILNKIDMQSIYYNRIKEGLRQVLYLGTGYGYTNTSYKPAGKTGTSESFLDLNNDGVNDVKTITSTYAMFAPFDDPKYTVVVVSPNIGHYDGKKGNMAYINRYLSNEITKLIYDNY